MNKFLLLIVSNYIASHAMAYGASSESYAMLTILNVAGTFGMSSIVVCPEIRCFNMMILRYVSKLECFVIWLPFGKYKASLFVFIVHFGFSYAETYALTGALLGAITAKMIDFEKRYGFAYAIFSFGNLISLLISSAFVIKDHQ